MLTDTYVKTSPFLPFHYIMNYALNIVAIHTCFYIKILGICIYNYIFMFMAAIM